MQTYADISDEPLDLAEILECYLKFVLRDRLNILAIAERFAYGVTESLTQDGLDVLELLYWRLFDTKREGAS